MKGTPSHGKRGKRKTHSICQRCGSRSFNMRRKACAQCGYGKSSKRND